MAVEAELVIGDRAWSSVRHDLPKIARLFVNKNGWMDRCPARSLTQTSLNAIDGVCPPISGRERTATETPRFSEFLLRRSNRQKRCLWNAGTPTSNCNWKT